MREPETEAIRMAVMTDGFEGQVWRDGFLAASRWWPAPPSTSEWISFLRSAGADLSQIPQPVPREAPLLNQPWTAASVPITDFWSLLQNDRATAIAAAVLAIPFLYLIGEAGTLGIANAHVNGVLASLSDANKSIRMERSAALADLDVAQKYLALDPYPSQFQLMASAARLLRDSKLSISEWTYNVGSLELVIHGDSPIDATTYIKAFEGDPSFTNVTTTSENQERDLRMRMQVNPREPGSS